LGDLIWSYVAMGCNMSLKLHFLHSGVDPPPPWTHGSLVRWTWRKVPSGVLLNWKEVQWYMVSKCDGRTVTRETATGVNKGQEKTNCMPDKLSLVRIPYIETSFIVC
jgi:hypothetical protein